MRIPTKPARIIKDIVDFFLFVTLPAALTVVILLGALYVIVKMAANG